VESQTWLWAVAVFFEQVWRGLPDEAESMDHSIELVDEVAPEELDDIAEAVSVGLQSYILAVH